MARQDIDIGIEGNDGTGDSIRESFRKSNENFQELYAVLGQGGSIQFTDLGDTPNDLLGKANNVAIVKSDSSGIDLLPIVSQGSITGDANDNTIIASVQDNKLVLQAVNTRVGDDPRPTLAGPLNGAGFAAGNIDVSDAAAEQFNDIHGTAIDVNDLVIDKTYADQNYLAKTAPGQGGRLSSEPQNTDIYIYSLDGSTPWSNGNAQIPDHGFDRGINGAPFVYNSDDTDAANITSGQTYFIRYVNNDSVSLHTSEQGAKNNTNKIVPLGGLGNQTLTDGALNTNLQGNWLSNEVLPREAIVRRQGDKMEGPLTLSDHPGALAGQTAPDGEDGLQAATKYYVDAQSYSSTTNLYVNESGDDTQTGTPAGQEGRSDSFAYRTIGAACAKAEELQLASPFEPGPYIQTITTDNGKTDSRLVQGQFKNPTPGSERAVTLIEENRAFILKETVAYVNQTFPDFEYNEATCERDLGLILDSVKLDIQAGLNANYLSRWAGIRYFSGPSGAIAVGTQNQQTVAGIVHARGITEKIIQNELIISLQDEITQFTNAESASAAITNSVVAKFGIVLSVIETGPLGAPNVVDGSTFELKIDNNGIGFVDQGNPENTDIIAGKIVRGKISGAKGRIVKYARGAGTATAEEDTIEVQLLEPTEFDADFGVPGAPSFVPGETLEYGNLVRQGQISIRVESGLYLEDYPIRVPENVSIKGDEFRRVIVRPKDRISQSRWARTYFYRDVTFDGLTANANTSVTGFAERGLARGGNPFVNPITGNVDGFFGYHYLEDPNDVNSTPRNNRELDVFMMNDATLLRNMTVQGHGGFMIVLDPDGQVLTKSPYIQTGSSFSASVNRQSFRGGMYIDGFTGNTPVRVFDKDNPFSLRIRSEGSQAEPQGLFVRRPQTPAPFYVDGIRYQVNAVSEYDQDTGTAVLQLDANSNDGQGFLEPVGDSDFSYDEQKWRNDFFELTRGCAFDIALGTNYNAVTNGLVYQRASRVEDLAERQTELLNAINTIRAEVSGLISADPDPYFDEIIDIIQNGVTSTRTSADALVLPPSNSTSTDESNAADRLLGNKNFLVAETLAYLSEEYPDVNYNTAKCQRDIGYLLDALTYDILYGGNSASTFAAQSYFEGTQGQLGTGQEEATAEAYKHLIAVTQTVITDATGVPTVTPTSGNTETQDAGGDPATATESDRVDILLSITVDVIELADTSIIPVRNFPDTSAELQSLQDDKVAIIVANADIVETTIDELNAGLPYPIILQTAGNRSMLGNDFTQVNDLGYGLVVNNSGLSEMVSMFTYYCWTAYYSSNGSQIRSLNGSNANGEYGLVAEGSDPNEIPDNVQLLEDMTQSCKTFESAVVLTFADPITVSAGDTITQTATPPGASAEVVFSTNSRTVFVKNVNGVLITADEVLVNGAGSGQNPTTINANGFTNDEEGLQLFVYDLQYAPNTRSELDILHTSLEILARYSVSNVEKTSIVLGRFSISTSDYTYTAGPGGSGSGVGASFDIDTTRNDGYSIGQIVDRGSQYETGDTFDILGSLLGGTDSTNDAVITVDEVDEVGQIIQASITGTVENLDTTPVRDGTVFRLNFSSGNENTENGLLTDVSADTFVQLRANQTFVFDNIATPEALEIRPSTAVILDAAPEIVYRSISFSTTDSVGNELTGNQSLAGFDSTFDYVRLIVDPFRAAQSDFAPGVETQGASAGDTVIAISILTDEDDRNRLNNNLLTEPRFRPAGFTEVTAQTPHLFVWQGRKYQAYNYREVNSAGEIAEDYAESNVYGLLDILPVSADDINLSAPPTGLSSPVVLGAATVTLRAGLPAGSPGNITVNISTNRATGHDFLDIGTGGFNQTNYPNIIFGNPREKQQPNEVDERGKGRVFWVSTDQDGFFRVGPFFTVDQGTGTVTFAASIALSNVDGIGFKRGVVVSEFSTDTAMTDNAADSVPVESAIRGYVNRRLGFDHAGLPVPNQIGPGVLVSNGSVAFTADINAAGNSLINLRDPISDSDAANKSYVDAQNRLQGKLTSLRDFIVNQADENQLFVFTGLKKIFIDADSIVGGPFELDDEIIGDDSGATGIVKDLETVTDPIDGNVVILYYEATSIAAISPTERVDVINGANGQIIDGPINEISNGINSPTTDIEIQSTRSVTVDPGTGDVTDRQTVLSLQLKSDTIVNSDVKSDAGILQSKLLLNAAQATRTNANGISQNDLGVAHFDSEVFTSTNGFVSISEGQLPLTKIQRINDGTVLGNITGDSSDNFADQLPFSLVIDQGGGLLDGDFQDVVLSTEDAGQALIKTGPGTYGVSNVSVTGEPNSVVKTQTDGSIRVNSLRLGGDNSYEILSLDTTELLFKTPGQGLILSAVGGSAGDVGGGIPPTFPIVEMPGSLSVGSTDPTESNLKAASNFAGESVVAVDWLYGSFIEAPGEKGAASTGIAIGANTGKTTQGQVGIIVADSGTSSSVSPATFSSTGFVPDIDDVYSIGSSTLKYNTMYATLFSGTASEAFYADLAENYVADKLYEFGTVVVFGGSQEITVTDKKGDRRVAGVVSHNPAHLMNTQLQGDTVVPLALQGRVPVKVIGSVQKGDILVTSAIPGFAIVDNNPSVGTVIGKAVGEKPDGDRGWVEVVVGRV